MTKQKILMAGSALVLSIAGIFASKADSRLVTAYYKPTSSSACQQYGSVNCVKAATGAICKTSANASARTLFTAIDCNTALRTNN